MKNKYIKVVDRDMETVSIHLSPYDCEMCNFLEVWVHDEELEIGSPFKKLEDAELFVDILIKLLNTVGEIDDIK